VTGLLRRIARFFRDESCGQCVLCRVGTVRQEELLGRLTRGAPLGSTRQELALLEDIASSADMALAAPEVRGWMESYGADPGRYGPGGFGAPGRGARRRPARRAPRARGQAGSWDESRQTVTTTICPYCGVGCNLDLHVQDNRIVKVTSPLDHDVGHGHLCVKGRFGFEFVQRRARES
jgi:Molybdopterin oxidoreductase Fe4S4 domain/NADH-ubiquinone oxidoreductase-F iron-sulfur binding region